VTERFQVRDLPVSQGSNRFGHATGGLWTAGTQRHSHDPTRCLRRKPVVVKPI